MGQTGQQTWNFKSYEQTGWNRSMTSTDSDAWSEWLLHGRHGGDTKYQQTIRDDVTKYADRVLDAARLSEGMTLADIGTGDGLVGLRAIERIGPSLNVLMTDVSSPLLRHVETLATQ